MIIDNVVSATTEKAEKTLIAFKELKATPEGLEIKTLRENLETLLTKKGGQILTVWYLKEDNRPRFDKRVVKLQRFQFQLAAYESRASVKEVRASGVEAKTAVVQNEECIDEKHFLFYNTKTGKFKLRLPTVQANGKPVTTYFLDNEEVSKEEFDAYVNSKYAPKSYGNFVQSFYALELSNIVCIK